MKARELQIGDLLYYKGKFNAFPFKVESITKKKVGYHAEPNDHRMYYLELSDCEPILLTPEILEDNGFTKELDADGLHYRFTLIDEHTKFSILYARSVFQWFSPLGFKYVHELQHALRLCGIKKEIM